LLEVQRELQRFGAVVRRAGTFGELRAQRIADEREDGVVGKFAARPRGGDRRIDDVPVLGPDRLGRNVRALDREHRNDLDQRAP
jgi:hypothetical protein